MEHLHTFLKSLILLLNEKGVEYLLVGGYAMRYYGSLRETRDLDLWVPPDPDNSAKIVEALREFGIDMPETTIAALSHPNRIVQVTLPPIRVNILDPIINQRPAILESFTGKQNLQVEFLTVQSGLNFQQAFVSRIMGILDGITVSIVSLEHLRTIKQTGGRPKDVLDLDKLP